MNRFEQVRRLIEYTVRNLVDCPQSVTVDMIEQEERIVYRLVVAQNDMEKVIGKRGCTARSIRTVLSAIGSKVNQDLLLDISGMDDDLQSRDTEESVSLPAQLE
jgi:predicted RNA-binding protein YlqC (UPF0109 family)